MRRVVSVLLLFFIALTISCDNNSKEGFPIFGIRIGDSPEQVEAILLEAGYTKNTESLSENFISLIFINYEHENRMRIIFADKKLSFFTSEIGRKDFETLVGELRTSLGYPSYYSSDEERAEWTIKNKPIVAKIDLIRNSSGRYLIGMIRDRMAEIDEGWY